MPVGVRLLGRTYYRPSRASRDRLQVSCSAVEHGRRCCGLCSVETYCLVFLFIANDAEHIVERSDALSGEDRLALDLIDAALLAAAGFSGAL